MIIVMKPTADQKCIDAVIRRIEECSLRAIPLYGNERTVIAVIGDSRKYSMNGWKAMDGVESVTKILKPYKLASSEHHPSRTVVKVGKVEIGKDNFVVIAGPCSVESEEQIMESAKVLKRMGVRIMRASAFKPRSSPYSFQGLGLEGLKLLKKVRDKTGLMVETEVMDVRDVKVACEYVDMIRVGARNMQNFDLLKEVGKVKTPVILKRGISATIEELIMAAEYILAGGNPNLILCERGIRTFETAAYRNTLDIAAVPVLKKLTHLPVIVDPSHAAGSRDLVLPLSMAAAAVGADGLLVEVHPIPEKALSDGAQSLYPDQLDTLMKKIEPICEAVGKRLV